MVSSPFGHLPGSPFSSGYPFLEIQLQLEAGVKRQLPDFRRGFDKRHRIVGFAQRQTAFI
jgi:hypothetical protein